MAVPRVWTEECDGQSKQQERCVVTRQERREGNKLYSSRDINGASVKLRTTQVDGLGSVIFGSARFAERMTSKAAGQSLHDTSCFNEYLTENETRREWSHESCSFLTTTAKRRDASRATRSDQNGVGSQDTWRGINGSSVKLRSTQAVRFGSFRFCSAQLGL